eukprot:scaffold143449_cov136-Phaeocystis_antarctica.AAC.1
MVRSGESCWWPAAMARTQARRTEWLSSSSATGKGGMLPSCQLGSPPSTRRRGRHAPRWLSNPLEAAAASERAAGGPGELSRPSASASRGPSNAEAARSREQGRPPSARVYRHRAEGYNIAPGPR